ncbi:MAG: hypothetical protein UT24_C0016G0010 [Candidatus Woesebacteria bacterium GW2011_GWB1_39_12]|uniref:Uncharacterized protein n=1 Tax=Candidatus Woesebacteria bacterium GW2011_GWB1_39_12 TaxID=1618574 RepID=A0A0G0MIF5_9BACT|nr:MAG: hypothetical protein UT24_C0016G0010 [Candidatus Woesebacteria bacterium GW2011_GWB1_39_12]
MLDDTGFGEIGKTEVGDVEISESPAEKTPETAPEQGSQDENVPFHEHPRWKEVYSKAQRVDELERQLKDLSIRVGTQPTPKEEWQPKTWGEVQQKIKEDLIADLQRQQEQSTAQQRQEDQALDSALSQLKTEKGEFDEKRLLNTAVKYGLGDINKAWEIMQLEVDAEKRGEKQALRKRVAPIGSSKKTEGGAKATTPYKSFKRRTLDDIVADAAEKISGQ